MIKLPTTPSVLIRLAVDDARKLDRKVYKPSFRSWHEPVRTREKHNGQHCLVCFGGAVMAGTLRRPANKYCTPFMDGLGVVHKQLNALEEFRLGNVLSGVRFMGITVTQEQAREMKRWDVSKYKAFNSWEHFDLFLSHQLSIAHRLEDMGY